MKIVRILVLLIGLGVAQPVLGFDCPYSSKSSLPPLVSTDLQKIKDNKTKLVDQKAKKVWTKKESEKNEKKLKRMDKGVERLTKEIAETEKRRRAFLCDIEEALQINKDLIQKSKKEGCIKNIAGLEKTAQDFKDLKDHLLSAQDIESVSAQMTRCGYNEDDPFERLDLYAQQLDQCGKKRQKKSIRQDFTKNGPVKIKKALFKKSTKGDREVVPVYVREEDPFLPDPADYGPPNFKAIVLFVHWTNQSASTSTRATVDQILRDAEAKFRHMSYGAFRPAFDVCEVDANMRRPTIASHEMPPTMFELCDEVVDFTQYQLIALYPTAAEGGKYLRYLSYSSTDFPSGTSSIRTIALGRLGFSLSILLHETTHALGSGPSSTSVESTNHAHNVSCDPYVFGGENCVENSDYGDYFDIMGLEYGKELNCAYKEKLGWAQSRTVRAGTTGTFVVPTLALPSPSVLSPSHCLKVEIDNAYTDGVFEGFLAQREVNQPCDNLYIEYRTPIGLDRILLNEYEEAGYYEDVEDGLLALHCMTSEDMLHTWVLDCTPNSQSHWRLDVRDGLLPPGEVCHTGLGVDVSFMLLPRSGRAADTSPSAWVGIRPAEEGICDGLDTDRDGEVDEDCVIGEERVCDGIDTNLNGTIDEGCDDDRDGYCDAAMETIQNPSGEWPEICRPRGPNDCNDEDPSISPQAQEICDNRDNNCNGEIDEGCDDDRDGYCDREMQVVFTQRDTHLQATVVTDEPERATVVAPKKAGRGARRTDWDQVTGPIRLAQERGSPTMETICAATGYSGSENCIPPDICPHGGGDCNDSLANAYPGAPENMCSSEDLDCDGVAHEGCPTCEGRRRAIRVTYPDGRIEIHPDFCYDATTTQAAGYCTPEGFATEGQISRGRCNPGEVCIDPDGPDGPIGAYCGTE